MSGVNSIAFKRLIEMNAEILSKAIPTGVVITDGIPVFKYNKATTKLLQDIVDLKYAILVGKE